MKQMQNLTIQVTQEDIDAGGAGDCRFCPVARAAVRAWPEPTTGVCVTFSYVGTGTVMLVDDAGRHYFRQTEEVSEFIRDFDEDGPEGDVGPFTATLEGFTPGVSA